MLKFKVGDTVKRTAKHSHGETVHGGEYLVTSVRPDGGLKLNGDLTYTYDEAYFELVATGTRGFSPSLFGAVEDNVGLTDKEVFNAIVDGKSLQYRFVGKPEWYDLKYPEKLTLLDVQRGTYRVRPTDVKLDCTVPYPEYSVGNVYSNKVRKFSVDFSTGHIQVFGEAELPSGGVFWSSREQAEQFRDTVLASLQGSNT